jgi:hypothetical protein
MQNPLVDAKIRRRSLEQSPHNRQDARSPPRSTFRAQADAHQVAFKSIEGRYNIDRRHSRIDCLSRVEHERKRCAIASEPKRSTVDLPGDIPVGGAMANLLILLTMPERIGLPQYDGLRAKLPDLTIHMVDHHTKVDPYLGNADTLVTFGPMMARSRAEGRDDLRWIRARHNTAPSVWPRLFSVYASNSRPSEADSTANLSPFPGQGMLIEKSRTGGSQGREWASS